MNLTDDKSTLVQVMAWCCQATSHCLNQCWPGSTTKWRYMAPDIRPYVCRQMASLGHSELTFIKRLWIRFPPRILIINHTIRPCIASRKYVRMLDLPTGHEWNHLIILHKLLVWSPALIYMCGSISFTSLAFLTTKLWNFSGFTFFVIRADSRFAPGQWEMALLCNDVSLAHVNCITCTVLHHLLPHTTKQNQISLVIVFIM